MNLTAAQLANNTLVAIDNAQRDLPQYGADLAAFQRDMYTAQTPQPKLCLYILQNIEAMYEERYEVEG